MIFLWGGLVLAAFAVAIYDIWRDDMEERRQREQDAEFMEEADMVKLELYRNERDPYFSHLMGCNACHAPTERYCQTGAELRRSYRVAYHAHKIASMPTRQEQIAYYKAIDDEIKDAVGAMVASRKEGVAE